MTKTPLLETKEEAKAGRLGEEAAVMKEKMKTWEKKSKTQF